MTGESEDNRTTVMQLLALRGSATIGRCMSETVLSNSAVVSALRTLRDRGLVERVPGDADRYRLTMPEDDIAKVVWVLRDRGGSMSGRDLRARLSVLGIPDPLAVMRQALEEQMVYRRVGDGATLYMLTDKPEEVTDERLYLLVDRTAGPVWDRPKWMTPEKAAAEAQRTVCVREQHIDLFVLDRTVRLQPQWSDEDNG